MYAAMLTVANLRGANNDVWEVNTDFEYHESQKVPTNGTRAQQGRPARPALDPQLQFHRPKPSLTG
jgi:hypothetical protein